MAFVRTGTASDADVHENLERPILAQPVPHSLEDDLFPILRQFPVLIVRLPVPRVGHPKVFEMFRGGAEAVGALPEGHRRIHPVLLGRIVIELQQILRLDIEFF